MKRVIVILLSFLLLLTSCGGDKAQTTADAGKNPIPLPPNGEGVTVREISPDALPSGVSSVVTDWMAECDDRMHLTDAVLWTFSGNVCELLLYRTDLSSRISLSASVTEIGLSIHTASTDQPGERALFYLSFPTVLEVPVFSLTSDGAKQGVLVKRTHETDVLAAFRAAQS